MQGSFFVISVFLQTVRGFNAISTGLILTLRPSAYSSHQWLQRGCKQVFSESPYPGGFVLTIIGIILLVWLASETSPIFNFVPSSSDGLGIGIMLTHRSTSCSPPFLRKTRVRYRAYREVYRIWGLRLVLRSSLGFAHHVSPGDPDFRLALITLVVIAGLDCRSDPPSPDSAQSGEAGITGEPRERSEYNQCSAVKRHGMEC